SLLAGISLWLYLRHRRSLSLRERFGPEYDRVVRQEGNVRRGEGVLEFREKKREKLQIRPLSDSARNDYANRWNNVQAQFVDDPEGSVAKADSLVSEVMEARGYPVADFDERVEIISVVHPVVVENYRAAHTIASSRAQREADGGSSTPVRSERHSDLHAEPRAGAAAADSTPLFPDDQLKDLQARWDDIQTGFVDEPRSAVEHADSLVASTMQQLAEAF